MSTQRPPADVDIRPVLRRSLLASTAGEDSVVVEELGLCRGQVRVDLAVVNGSLHGYEIKSDRDSLDRLAGQADVYSKVLDQVTLVVGERHLAHAMDRVPAWWGVTRVDDTAGGPELHLVRAEGENPALDRRALVDMEPDLAPYRLLIQNGLPAVMVAHVAYPAVEDVPASTSSRWIRGVLRGQMHFQGLVFADDMSMAGAASVGGIVERAERALAAGCDVLPVCNHRPSVLALLEGLKHRPDPASALRLVRLRGKGQITRSELQASSAWRQCRVSLERCMKPPALSLS